MQNVLVTKLDEPIDAANANHVRAAKACLDAGDVNGACQEMRKIQRRVAGTGAVIQLRRRLVQTILGMSEA